MLSIDTSKILDKEMDRKQFLKNVGVGAVAFTGLTAALRAISQMPSSTTGQPIQGAEGRNMPVAGYGTSVYGGSKAGRTAA